jgi:hypothetical protein
VLPLLNENDVSTAVRAVSSTAAEKLVAHA